MLDFASALYLGMRHPSVALPAWAQLTTGAPAALASTPGTALVEAELARLTAMERAVLAPSTLHLCWDLFGVLAARAVYVDAGAYPIARSATERALARGAVVRTFRHYDVAALDEELSRGASPALVVVDGFCPSCGRAAPLRQMLELVQRHGALLLVDDTQALGLYGPAAGPAAPYGVGGGGSVARAGVAGPELVVVASLAKAFGVPVAVLLGGHAVVEQFVRASAIRVHCSGPSSAAVAGALRALELNRWEGAKLRRTLAARVRLFRRRVGELGLAPTGGLFPVQRLVATNGFSPTAVHACLAQMGVRTVLQAARCGARALAFVLTALHRCAEIESAVRALGRAVAMQTTSQIGAVT